MTEDLFKELKQAIMEFDIQKAVKSAEGVLETGVDPLEAVSKGLSEGMKVVGEKFKNGEIFLPEVIQAADTFSAVMAILEPKILEKGEGKAQIGTVVIGTVQGDIHYIGKDMVANMLKTAGFNVVNLGVDVKPSTFLDEAEKAGADIIAASSLLTTTMVYQQDIIEFMEHRKVRDKYYYIIGGSTVTQEWADEIGADAFGRTAQHAIDILHSHIEKKERSSS